MRTLSQFVHPVLQMVKACLVGQIKAINGHHGSTKEHFTEIRKLILARRIPEKELIQKISLLHKTPFLAHNYAFPVTDNAEV